MPMEKVYALVDCQNFYASCERVFEPALRERPVGRAPLQVEKWETSPGCRSASSRGMSQGSRKYEKSVPMGPTCSSVDPTLLPSH